MWPLHVTYKLSQPNELAKSQDVRDGYSELLSALYLFLKVTFSYMNPASCFCSYHTTARSLFSSLSPSFSAQSSILSSSP